MAIINNVNEVLHRIRAKLYPNYLHGIDGAYIVSVHNVDTLWTDHLKKRIFAAVRRENASD
jgi:hypothetical protein